MATLASPPQIAILNPNSKLFDIILGVYQTTGLADAFMPVVLNANGQLDFSVLSLGNIKTVTADYTVASSDSTILCDASTKPNGLLAITMPDPVANKGVAYRFKKQDGSNPQIVFIYQSAVTSNVVTLTSNNNFQTGQLVSFAGLTAASFLNGQTLAVQSASSSNFTVNFTHANYVATTESGEAFSSSVTINHHAAETFNFGKAALTSLNLANPGDSVVLQSDGTNWQIIGSIGLGFGSFQTQRDLSGGQATPWNVIPAGTATSNIVTLVNSYPDTNYTALVSVEIGENINTAVGGGGVVVTGILKSANTIQYWVANHDNQDHTFVVNVMSQYD